MLTRAELTPTEAHFLGELFKALNTTAVATACVIWGIYLPAMVRGLRERPVSRAWWLLFGILLTWAGIAVFYGTTAWLQWGHYTDPLVSTVPNPVRLLYLVLALSGGAIHVSAAYRERLGVVRTFLLWSAGVACACVLMILFGD